MNEASVEAVFCQFGSIDFVDVIRDKLSGGAGVAAASMEVPIRAGSNWSRLLMLGQGSSKGQYGGRFQVAAGCGHGNLILTLLVPISYGFAGKCKGYAFVCYTDPESAALAMQHMNEVVLQGPFEGRAVKVTASYRPPARTPEAVKQAAIAAAAAFAAQEEAGVADGAAAPGEGSGESAGAGTAAGAQASA